MSATTRLASALLLLAAIPMPAAAVIEVHYVMGTYLRIEAEEEARPAMRRCFKVARQLERVFSRYDAASELSRVHTAPGQQPVSPDFARLLRRAQALTRATDGAFDVTVGSLTALWRTGTLPDGVALAAARGRVGTQHARLDGDRLTLATGARLDFDGIAKGHAVDACVALLREAGVARALVSFGESSLYALGAPRGARFWRTAVRGLDPDHVVGRLALRDQALSVSAAYGGEGRDTRRGFGHIVDPRSGQPLVEEGVAVVVASSATDAEAFTKALLLWGRDGLERTETRSGGRALYIDRAGVRLGSHTRRAGCFEAFGAPRPIPDREVAIW